VSTTNDHPEPDIAGSPEASEAPASRRKRRVLIVSAIALTVALVAGAVVTAGVVQAQQLEQAQADVDAAAAAAAADALAAAKTEADKLAQTIDGVLEALVDGDGEALLDVDVEQLVEARDALDGDYEDASSVRTATFAAVRELDVVLRFVLADGRATIPQVTLAGDDALSDLEQAVAALGGAPYGVPSSYAGRDDLVAAVLAAVLVARDAHYRALVVAEGTPAGGTTAPGGSTSSGGGTSGGGSSGGTNSGGGSSGGGGGGGGTTAPPPPPPPHPRAALCESLGFTNNTACLNNEPTYVTTNSAYVPLSSCIGQFAYGSHTPGFGGTSRPSYTFPWSYRIDYASSGLGTVRFFTCAND
jgi:uncharacterized membrane protein YgcG